MAYKFKTTVVNVECYIYFMFQVLPLLGFGHAMYLVVLHIITQI